MKLSVVIPLYNRADLILETLRSIERQTAPVHEIFVVDDGSHDGGADAVELHFNHSVTVLRHANNQGVQAARNTGLARCTGDWVVFCDSDDLWLPDFVAANERLLRQNPDLDVVFSNFRHLVDGVPETATKFDSAPAGWWAQVGQQVTTEGWVFDEKHFVGHTFRWHPVFTSSTLLSMRAIQRAGAFSTRLKGLSAEDGEFYLRCLYGSRVGALPDPLVLIRKHSGNFSGDQLKNLVDEVWMLGHILATHPEAAAFKAIIAGEIRKRRVEAAGLAFEVCDHELFKSLYRDIDPADRSATLKLKGLCAVLPSPIGYRMNRTLQWLSTRVRHQKVSRSPSADIAGL